MKPTPAFTFLRAMGRPRTVAPSATIPTKPPSRLGDPASDLVTQALIAANLWRWDMGLSVERKDGRVTFRLFIPEQAQNERLQDSEHAAKARAVMDQALRAGGFAVRMADTLFCERGKKGHEVVLRAVVVTAVGGAK